MKSTNIYKATLIKETEKAICISFGCELGGEHECFNFKNIWVPKSQISEVEVNEKEITFVAPEWLITAKVRDYCVWVKETFSNVKKEVAYMANKRNKMSIDYTYAI